MLETYQSLKSSLLLLEYKFPELKFSPASIEVQDDISEEYDTFNSKDCMKLYDDIISKMERSVHSFTDAYECACLIHKWFSIRFDSRYSLPSGYRADHIWEWIENIIIAFGYHTHNHTILRFRDDFSFWCDHIPKGEKYILPRYIYKYSKSIQLREMTRESVAIYNILLKYGGLDEFTKLNSRKYRIGSCHLEKRYSDVFDNLHLPIENYPIQFTSFNIEEQYCECGLHMKDTV